MNPDFRTFIESYDILIFQESKTDELDVLELPNNYMCFSKHRRNVNTKSGGIVIVFKIYLLKSLTFISSVRICTMSAYFKRLVYDRFRSICRLYLYFTRKLQIHLIRSFQ